MFPLEDYVNLFHFVQRKFENRPLGFFCEIRADCLLLRRGHVRVPTKDKRQRAQDHYTTDFRTHPFCLRRTNTAIPTSKTRAGSTTTISQKNKRDCVVVR